MASSNVEYYEKQKELQDTITNCEQKRMDLEKQLRLSLQAGQTSSQLKAVRLQTYWKKICEDEKKAKLRNEALLREFERIDAHMHEMNARTQRLALMKKQYEDYVFRTYPQWNELMYGKPQSQPQNERPDQDQHIVRETSTPAPVSQLQQEFKGQDSFHSIPISHSPAQVTESSSSAQSHVLRQNEQTYDVSKESYHKNDFHQESEIYQNLPSSYSGSEKEQEMQSLEDVSSRKADVISQPVQIVEIHSQPVQSVEIHSKSGQAIQSKNSMQPPADEDDEEDTFGTDNDIPMAQSVQNTMVRADSVESNNDTGRRTHGTIKPELSIDGLLCLLRLVENDIADAFSLEGYYRSSWPETSIKNDIIRKANSDHDLSRIDVNLISMVVLEQITLIIRSLSEKCIIPESVLQGDITIITPQKLSQRLSPEAQIVWNALFAHFVKLVEAQVMKSYELSAIFTPCMVSDNTSQDKAHTFLVQLLENIESENADKQALLNTGTSFSPAGTMEGSGSFVEDGKVPRLKFGSLLDKPLSDDDSSFINSLPRDGVPLNETAAYKSMLSTGGSDRPVHQSYAQEDTTDDDVEKQIASALTKPSVVHQSPRKQADVDDPSETSSQTLQTTSHVYVPTAMETRSPRRPAVIQKPKFQGVKISSDLDTDTEVDVGILGSSRQAEDNNDFDFYD